jgi:anion-transporting  ArsA/GET3 family ATPase
VGSLAPVPGLLDKRLVVVTGKGGVGKTTVAAALGLAAARMGKRTIVAELASQSEVAAVFGAVDPGFHELELREGLFTISIDPEHAIEEYLRVKAGPLAELLVHSRAFTGLAQATPGLRELVSLGKAWELARTRRRTPGASPYDLVILDAPASGHALGLLRTPGTFAEVARIGPIAHQGRAIAESIADRSFTGVLAVARAEEMPVTETLALRDGLRRDLRLGLDAVVVNGLLPDRFTTRDRAPLRRALDTAGTPAARAALQAALSAQLRARGQREQLARLTEGVGTEPVTLPFVIAPELGEDGLELISRELELAL